MSRSRRPQCSVGDAGAIRRAREAQSADAIPDAMIEHLERYYSDEGWGDEDETFPEPSGSGPLRVTLVEVAR